MTGVTTVLSSSVPSGLTQWPPDNTATTAVPSRVLPGAYGGCAGREGGSRRPRRACALCWRLTVSLARVRPRPELRPRAAGARSRWRRSPSSPPPTGGRGRLRVAGRRRGPGIPRPRWSSFEAPRLFTVGQLEPSLSPAPTN